MVDEERYLGLSTRVAVVFHLLILKSKQFLPGARDSINPKMIQIPAFYTSLFRLFWSWHKNDVVAFPIAFFILKYFYQNQATKNIQKNIVSILGLHVYLPYFHNVGNNASCPCMIEYRGRLNQDRQVGLKLCTKSWQLCLLHVVFVSCLPSDILSILFLLGSRNCLHLWDLYQWNLSDCSLLEIRVFFLLPWGRFFPHLIFF